MFKINKIDAAKELASLAVKALVAKKVTNAITANTSRNADDIAVVVAAGYAGHVAGDALRPYTDNAVDQAAAYLRQQKIQHDPNVQK